MTISSVMFRTVFFACAGAAIASASRRNRAKDANAVAIALLGVVMAVAAGRLPAMNAPRAAMGFSSFVAGPDGRPR